MSRNRSAIGETRAMCFAFLFSFPCTAFAYESQMHLGGEIGYAHVSSESDLPGSGMALGLRSEWGFHESLTLRGMATYALHGSSDVGHSLGVHSDVIYLFDLLRVVPYAGVGMGGIYARRASQDGGNWSLHVAAGVDYFLSPRWVLGGEVRAHYLPLDRSSVTPQPWFLQALVALRYGFDTYR